jgi:predicted nucleic acid-binding protein
MLTIDSNIWAYYLDSNLPEHKKVIKPVEDIIAKNEILMTTIIQMEMVHYLIKRLGPVIGKEKLDIFLNYPFTLDTLDRELVFETSEVLQKYSYTGIGARDASIIASMRRFGVKEIMTHDTALKRIDGIRAIDPCESR